MIHFSVLVMEQICHTLSHKEEVTLNKWNALFVNDPDNDYNLMIELEYEEENVGYIVRKENRIEVVFYPSVNKITLPLDWLENVLDKAKLEL